MHSSRVRTARRLTFTPGYTPRMQPRWMRPCGWTPPPPLCGQNENVPFPILCIWAVKIVVLIFIKSKPVTNVFFFSIFD